MTTTNDMIRAAGWFNGSSRQWDDLPSQEKKDRAFAALGCEAAYATWTPPVDCVHTGCLIRRGKLPKIAQTNRIMRDQIESNWLRFCKDTQEGRDRLAKILRAVRKYAMETGIYDPWKMPGGWAAIVGAGVAS